MQLRLIFNSHMKSSGIKCSSQIRQEGKHTFLFSLRSLRQNSGRKLDLTLDFAPSNSKQQQIPNDEKNIQTDNLNPCQLLPCFSLSIKDSPKAQQNACELQSWQTLNQAIANCAGRKNSVSAKIDKVMEAIPKSEYCQICKQTFADYLKHLNHPVHIRKFEAQSKNKLVDEFVKTLNSSDLSVARARRFVADQEDMDCYRSSKVRVIQIQNTRTPMRLSATNNPSAYRNPQISFN